MYYWDTQRCIRAALSRLFNFVPLRPRGDLVWIAKERRKVLWCIFSMERHIKTFYSGTEPFHIYRAAYRTDVKETSLFCRIPFPTSSNTVSVNCRRLARATASLDFCSVKWTIQCNLRDWKCSQRRAKEFNPIGSERIVRFDVCNLESFIDLSSWMFLLTDANNCM
jgi:hypothetical protein